MARFERLVLLGGLAAGIAACNLIAGLGAFQDVACDPCDAGLLDGTSDAFDAADGDAAPEAAPLLDAGGNDADADADTGTLSTVDASDAEASAGPQAPDGATSPDYRWALWRMPNGAEAGLPNPASYTATDAGVIVDNTTGLIWGHAQNNIPSFDGGASLACAYPWRLPTRIELVSILDTSQSSVLVNPIFTTVTNMVSEAYWTASVHGDAGPWTVSFNDGTIAYGGVGSAVICVQSGDGGAP